MAAGSLSCLQVGSTARGQSMYLRKLFPTGSWSIRFALSTLSEIWIPSTTGLPMGFEL